MFSKRLLQVIAASLLLTTFFAHESWCSENVPSWEDADPKDQNAFCTYHGNVMTLEDANNEHNAEVSSYNYENEKEEEEWQYQSTNEDK